MAEGMREKMNEMGWIGIAPQVELTVEEVALSGPVPAHDYIVPLVEWVDDRLFAVAFEALDDDLREKIE